MHLTQGAPDGKWKAWHCTHGPSFQSKGPKEGEIQEIESWGAKYRESDGQCNSRGRNMGKVYRFYFMRESASILVGETTCLAKTSLMGQDVTFGIL